MRLAKQFKISLAKSSGIAGFSAESFANPGEVLVRAASPATDLLISDVSALID
jgi:hypothetical protein